MGDERERVSTTEAGHAAGRGGAPAAPFTGTTRENLRWLTTVLGVAVYLHDVDLDTVAKRLEIGREELTRVLDGEGDLTTDHIAAVLRLAGIEHHAFYNAVFRFRPPGPEKLS